MKNKTTKQKVVPTRYPMCKDIRNGIETQGRAERCPSLDEIENCKPWWERRQPNEEN